ncbi:MAG: L,D-transpeptidase family protein [Candidatus Paceibacterota bacterium]|jgi:L,D-peptidoglycan transpeptidase YkuD (ErfK/YbiS/YcfS/YnhG family)
MSKQINTISVSPERKLIWNNKEYKCSLGENGVSENKKEGDKTTPVGCFSLREVYFRSDRIEKPMTELPTKALTPNDGWCDNPNDQNYNRFIKLPYSANAESLWREDNLYDVIVVIGYNDDPIFPNKGSAIFIHIAREEYKPTAGCIGLALPDLLEILATIEKNTIICINKS